MTDIKNKIKELCQSNDTTFKELAEKAGMNYNGLHDKFRRNSITLSDFKKLLDVLGYELKIVPKATSKKPLTHSDTFKDKHK